MTIANSKNFAAGVMFVIIGIAVAAIASGYRMGTASAMGPGYFPFWLGVILAAIGAGVLFTSVRPGATHEGIGSWHLRILLLIVVSVVIFGLLLDYLGVVAAVAGLVLVSSFASHEFGWGATLSNIAILIALTFLIFIFGLTLQIPVWPPFLAQ
jgi:hypothetical protein